MISEALPSIDIGHHASAAARTECGVLRFSYTPLADDPEPPIGWYRNPILVGFHPDPAICRSGEDYYLVNSTFGYFPGLPIYHSRDLVNWTCIGHAIDRPGQLDYTGIGMSDGLYAPSISIINGRWYILCTMVRGIGNFVIEADRPEGPWSDPIALGFDGIDPALFQDPATKRCYVVNNGPPDGQPRYDGHRAIWWQEIDLPSRRMTGPRQVVIDAGVNPSEMPIWVEGPRLFERGGWYYLTTAEGGTAEGHSQTIWRSRSVRGPFEPWTGNPILTQRDLDSSVESAVTCAGHADIFEGPDGRWWCTFLGCRPYDRVWYPTGRETFLLPVHWREDGWPMILAPGERIPLIVPAPRRLDRQHLRNPGCGGRRTFETYFCSDRPEQHWLRLNTSGGWWRSSDRGLILDPSASGSSPAFFGRRVEDASFQAQATVIPPKSGAAEVGLTAYQGPNHRFSFLVRRSNGKAIVSLDTHDGSRSTSRRSCTLPDGPHFTLELACRQAFAIFRARSGDGPWCEVAVDMDARILTTRAAGGFVGATVGPWAALHE